MSIFEVAKSRADALAPAPADTPRVAAATAFGFGLLVIGFFIVLQWLGLPFWLAWLASALGYGGIAWADCQLGWTRHREHYRDALAELKAPGNGPAVH